MRIGTRNVVLITPIFLLLATVATLLMFVTEQRELRWGLESEAQGLASTIAEFSAPAGEAPTADGSDTPASIAGVRAAAGRLLARGTARRVELFHFAPGGPRRVLDLGERAGEPPALGPELLRRVALGQEVVGRAADGGRLAAHAPILDASGGARGLVTVETSLAPLAEHRSSVVWRSALVVLALVAGGIVVSLALSTVMTRGIGRLHSTAEAFASGNYDARPAPSRIEEMAEVGSTFAIMGSVLKDAAQRSARQVLALERTRSEEEIAEHFAARFLTRVEAACGGVAVAIDAVGPATRGDFWFVREGNGRCHACLGRVEQPGALDAVLAGSACAALLQDGLDRGGTPADVLPRAGGILPIHCCVLLEWGAGGGGIVAHRLEAGNRASRATLQVPQHEAMGGGPVAVVTTLDEAADRKAARYAGAHAFRGPATCIDELRRFFGGGLPGGVLALQRTDRC